MNKTYVNKNNANNVLTENGPVNQKNGPSTNFLINKKIPKLKLQLFDNACGSINTIKLNWKIQT